MCPLLLWARLVVLHLSWSGFRTSPRTGIWPHQLAPHRANKLPPSVSMAMSANSWAQAHTQLHAPAATDLCRFPQPTPSRSPHQVGVSSEPDHTQLTLTAADKFMVLASDGVWEFITSREAVEVVAKSTDVEDACRSVRAGANSFSLGVERIENTCMRACLALCLCACASAAVHTCTMGGRT